MAKRSLLSRCPSYVLPKFVNTMNGHIIDRKIKAFRSAHTTTYVYDLLGMQLHLHETGISASSTRATLGVSARQEANSRCGIFALASNNGTYTRQ